MSTRNDSGDTSRKPSGSSTHSGGHSPSSSPTNAQAQRKLAPNAFGVPMSGATGLKGLDTGWQVWGSAPPGSKRNASISSATSVQELSTQGDANYRGNLGEGWSSSGPTSGTWDESGGSPQGKEISQTESHPSLSLHHARQRQAPIPAFPVSRVDDWAISSASNQFPSQGYDFGFVKDMNPSRFSVGPPTKPTGFSGRSYIGQPPGPPGHLGHDIRRTPSVVEADLPMAFRGMAVEDDYNAGRHQFPIPQSVPVQGHNQPLRQLTLPPRAPYNIYPQAEYGPFYNNPGREPYVDYQYGYDAYRAGLDPSLYANPRGMSGTSLPNMYPSVSPVEVHRQQPGVFFDYGRSVRPPPVSQFYYPLHQPLLYPPTSHSPMLTPQLAQTNPSTLADKKYELQYRAQQQIAPSNLMYNAIRSTPSPHPQAYAASLDYSQQQPLLLPGGAVYGYNPQISPLYQSSTLHPYREAAGTSIALRSPLLDEFRANRSRKWELQEIFGFIVEFSGDQHGSRFIQQRLETATSEEKQILFQEIVPDSAIQLIQDVFGNYVIQKLFEHGTQIQKTQLANVMEGNVLRLSLQMYGCRVVQKAIEFILPEQQGNFVNELEPHVLKCVKDANGNHVIQKLIERVPPERLTFVNTFRGNVYDLASHPYGCRVLQRCFEHLPDDQSRPLLDELHKYSMNLMQDQFGNYVIQFILEQGKPHDRALVLSKLRGHMLHMARHKFASNVCEKALITADPENRRLLINEIMTHKQDSVNPIVTMMKDQFANYVLQRALAAVEGEQKEELFAQVRPQLANMRRYSSAYNKHLLSIERLLEKRAPEQES